MRSLSSFLSNQDQYLIASELREVNKQDFIREVSVNLGKPTFVKKLQSNEKFLDNLLFSLNLLATLQSIEDSKKQLKTTRKQAEPVELIDDELIEKLNNIWQTRVR